MQTPSRGDALLYAAQGVQTLVNMPTGSVPTDVVRAHAAKAHALASLAAAYALLDVADAIRESNPHDPA